MKALLTVRAVLVLIFLAGGAGEALAGEVRIGSKRFTESYVLGYIVERQLEAQDLSAEHLPGMGGTVVLWQALRGNGIQVYPEYTGTIAEQILGEPGVSRARMRSRLQDMGIGMTRPLGFNNTYALVVRRETAEELGLESISDLRAHPELVFGFTHEFIDRADGWKPLAHAYGLDPEEVRGVDHAIAYQALAAGQLDVMDAYSTDAKMAQQDLVVLDDDREFFPKYEAVFLYRLELSPAAVAALRELEGQLSARRMIRLNAKAEETKDFRAAAAAFFGEEADDAPGLIARIWPLLLEHLALVGLSMLAAVAVGLPVGIAASRRGAVSQLLLSVVGVFQTIPALALLALLVAVPGLGISVTTAIVALFLYSLLPIVRNTATGLQDIAPAQREMARALGLKPWRRLVLIYLPLAARSILAGIKTSAVINVGTATLAALIGAGGLGEPIISGLSLNDHRTILIGAIPAALLALLVQAMFEGADRCLIPRGLR